MPDLTMRDIHKRFGEVQALKGVDLRVPDGSLHAIVGENGAGKSTLMKILYGQVRPDRGTIELDGSPVSFTSPAEAIQQGIGMVHQHFRQIPSFSVTENVILGEEPRSGPFLDRGRARDEVRELIERYELDLDPDRPIRELSMGERQRVEIAKILYRSAELMIFDETTSVLTPQQAERLFEILDRFVEAGKTVLYITHKLPEVFRLGSEVTVLRDGEVVSSRSVAETDAQRIARDMTDAEDLTRHVRTSPAASEVSAPASGSPVLEARDLWAVRPNGVPALRGVDLSLHGGEILGVAGVEGNGQGELARVLIGTMPLQAGTIRFRGESIEHLGVKQRRGLGIGWIPSDRYRLGSALEGTIAENLVADRWDRPPFAHRGLLRTGSIHQYTEGIMADYDIRAPGPRTRAGALSGGNLQRLIVGREIGQQRSVLVASNPTQGLDIQAAAFVREKLRGLREEGMAVLLVSADLDEVIALSDRILVLYEGSWSGEFEGAEADRERIGWAMVGEASGADRVRITDR